MVVKEDTEINEVIELILQKHIILVPVINDQQRLVGVVSRLDILRLLVERIQTLSRTLSLYQECLLIPYEHTSIS